jgi:hypothetical protein
MLWFLVFFFAGMVTLLHYYQSSNNVGKMYEFMLLKRFVVLDQLDQETGKCASEFTWQLILRMGYERRSSE